LAHVPKSLLDECELGGCDGEFAMRSGKHNHRSLLDIVDGMAMRVRHQEGEGAQALVDRK
jgi:hypothetical protein